MHSTIKRNVLQHKINTKTKARFSRLLQRPAWKWIGPIFMSALYKLVPYLLKTPTYLQLQDPHGACTWISSTILHSSQQMVLIVYSVHENMINVRLQN